MKHSLFVVPALLTLLSGCGSSEGSTPEQSAEVYPPRKVPPFESTFSYRLGNRDINGSDADYYVVDLEDTSAEDIAVLQSRGRGVICYMSAGSAEEWRDDFGEFEAAELGNTLDGWPDERWLDIRSLHVKEIMKARLESAKEKGCDGVEADNVDGYNNETGFDLSYDDSLSYNLFLADEAHKRGLSIGLKNNFLQMQDLVESFDFAITEESFFQNNTRYLQPFLEAQKAVFNAEYNERYLDKREMVKLCNASDALHVNTQIVPKELDGSFEYNCKDYLYQQFGSGFGGGNSFLFHKDVWLDVYDILSANYSPYTDAITNFNTNAFERLSQNAAKSRYVMIWVTQEWQESWYSVQSLQNIIDSGRIPVFIYWYFGDHLGENGYLDAHKEEYLRDAERLGNFLKQLHGRKFLLFEPEFNKENILAEEAQSFIAVIGEAIDTVKRAGVTNVAVSLTMMDTGRRDANLSDTCNYENCALGDEAEWSRAEAIYSALLPKLDFISFQEMVGQFSRDPQNPGSWDAPNPKAYDDAEIGIDYLPQRVANFAGYLKDNYNKPVFLPYITIATATWSDANGDGVVNTDEIDAHGWEQKALAFYRDLSSENLFGFGVMELFDDPKHDSGGYQFFMQNEYHLGIVSGGEIEGEIDGNLSFKSGIIEEVFKER